MEKELDALTGKINDLVQALAKLREENRQQRQQLAAKTDEITRLNEKAAAAVTRLEALLRKLPE